MKQSLWYHLLAACAVSLSFAGQVGYAAPQPAHHYVAAKMNYICPKCHMQCAAAGKCARCHVALVRKAAAAATYECAMCSVKSSKAGQCPQCGMAMTRAGAKSHTGVLK